jgi:hypothetical protein
MLFKTARVEEEWSDPRVNPTLKEIISEAEAFASKNYGWEILLSCVYRTAQENYDLTGLREGVHTLWRGADIRIRGRDPAEVLALTTYVNDRWIYDDVRPNMRCALIEGGGPQSSAPHVHLQAHARTRLTLTPEESTLAAT